MLKKILQDVGSDEVRRQIVAGLIIAAIIGALALLTTGAAKFLPSFSSWLLTPVPIDRLQVALWALAALVTGLVVGRMLPRTRYVEVRTLREELEQARAALAKTQVGQQTRAAEIQVSDDEKGVLMYLASLDGTPAKLSTSAAALKQTRLRTEQLLDGFFLLHTSFDERHG